MNAPKGLSFLRLTRKTLTSGYPSVASVPGIAWTPAVCGVGDWRRRPWWLFIRYRKKVLVLVSKGELYLFVCLFVSDVVRRDEVFRPCFLHIASRIINSIITIAAAIHSAYCLDRWDFLLAFLLMLLLRSDGVLEKFVTTIYMIGLLRY